MQPNLKAIAAGQGGVFTAAQARACGYSDKEIRRLRSSGRWPAIRRGIYVDGAVLADADAAVGHRIRVAAALLVIGPKAVASHQSAAKLWGLGTLEPLETGIVELTVPRGAPVRYPGLHVRPASLPMTHRAELDGLPVTSLARTVIDIGRTWPHREGVVLADSAMRDHSLSRADLQQVLKDCWNWRGIPSAVRVVAFADPRAESVAESLARVLFAELGLSAPELQAEIWDDRGFVGRVDFLFKEHNTIVEVDGRVKYEDDPKALWREKKREDRLREAGYAVVRLTWADLMNDPQEVLARLRAAFIWGTRHRR